MALYCAAADVPVGTVDMTTTSFSTTLVHGASASLMVAQRPPGYHSRPHIHPCEQLNLLRSGRLHVFCAGEAYVLDPGDVLRIPPDAVHWSWNRGHEPCVLIEVHAPGLQSDPLTRDFAMGLFADGETGEPTDAPTNVFVDLPAGEVERIEALEARHVA
jgi:mannose-6-phosphate isomerase-like protein (cupin superfamily)